MPIREFLTDTNFDPETTRVMGIAFEMARAAMHLTDPADPAARLIAGRIIALAKNGERNPDALCDGALIELRQPPLP